MEVPTSMETQIVFIHEDRADVWCPEDKLDVTLVNELANPLLPNLGATASVMMKIDRLIKLRRMRRPYSHIEAELGVEIYPDLPSGRENG